MALELTDELSALLTESQPRIYGFIFKRVAQHDLTLEILQETNLVICRKANDFISGTNFIAWAFKIAHFQILSQRQKANAKPIFSDKALELIGDIKENDGQFKDKLNALGSCLKALSDENRSLIMKRYTGKFSVQEYAKEAGKRENAVSKALHKIRHNLGRCIKIKISEAL